MNFRIFGIRFEISFLFTAILALILITDKTGLIFLFFSAALIHEAAHLAVMLFLKSKPQAVRLIPGGINIVENNMNTPLEDLLILIAGPLSNLVLYLAGFGDFSYINLLLFIYNLLPVSGLDGGRITELILCRFMKKKSMELIGVLLTVTVSALFLGFFVFTAVYEEVNYSILIFSLYLISTLFLKKGIERNG